MTIDPRAKLLDRNTVEETLTNAIGPDNARRVMANLEPKPVPQPSATGWQRPSRFTRRWFQSALAAIETQCIGFDAAQATQPGAEMERFPLSLLSDRHFVLRLRYPLGPVMRIAEFIIDLEDKPPAVTVLDGMSAPFHALLEDQKEIVSRRATSAERVTDFARIFCQFLEANSERRFIPCESGAMLAGRYLGDLPPALAAHARTWERLTTATGVPLNGSVAHLIHGTMLFDSDLFLVQLLVTLRTDSRNPAQRPPNSVRMVYDVAVTRQAKSEVTQPIVPVMRNLLTHAVFPKRGAA